jgi:hypothetical protein
MKSILMVVILFITMNTMMAQEYQYSSRDIEQYKTSIVKSKFDDTFKKESDRTNFKLLREFLIERKDLLVELNYATYNYKDGTKFEKSFKEKVNFLKDKVKNKPASDIIDINPSELTNTAIDEYYYTVGISPYEESSKYYDYYTGQVNKAALTVQNISELIGKYEGFIETIAVNTDINNKLTKNIGNVNEDIYECTKQLDSALAPEYKEQEFRKIISFIFALLIGILLIIFFFIVYKKSDNNLSKELLSGQGLQFITLFVLIIAIILFGILNILQGSELAAILAGISGYILGKGIPVSKVTEDTIAKSETDLS